MSLAIDVDKVEAVLLNVWYDVEVGSFDLDSYEYLYWPDGKEGGSKLILQGGGDYGVCANGFSFTPKGGGSRMAGPLTAILAVAYTV